MDQGFLQGRIDSTKLQIIAYEDAAYALAGGVQTYTLDTGQSKQQVTKLDLKQLQDTIDSLYNRCEVLQARLTGGATVVIPAW